TWTVEQIAERVAEIVDALVKLDKKSKEAGQFLDANEMAHDPPHLAREFVIEVLAHTYAHLTAYEISQRMQDLGYEPRGEHPERYVAKILRENPSLFERHSGWRWGLNSYT